jgi:hypothetical protein
MPLEAGKRAGEVDGEFEAHVRMAGQPEAHPPDQRRLEPGIVLVGEEEDDGQRVLGLDALEVTRCGLRCGQVPSP